MKKLAVTGNRPKSLNKVMKYGNFDDPKFLDYIELLYAYVLELMSEGFDYFISGGALGVDLDFAESVIHQREDIPIFKHVKLEIAIPCENQDLKWKEKDRQRYRQILDEADFKIQVGITYTKWCMQKRNEYMVNNADKVLAFWNGKKQGGTWNTIQYCKQIGKDIVIVDLRNLG